MRVTRNRKTNPIVSAVIVGIIGVVFLIAGLVQLIALKTSTKVDLATCSGSDIEDGTYVEVDLDGDTTYVYGYYAEMQETSYGVFKRSTDRYYLIDACANAEFFMGVKVSKSLYDQMEDICDYSYDESAGKPETLHIVGKVRKQSGDAENYMENFICELFEWLSYDAYTYSKSDIQGYYLPYYIDVIKTTDWLFPTLFGLALLVIAILIIVISTKKKNNVTYTQPAGGYSDPYAGSGSGYTDPYAGSGSGYTDPYAGSGSGYTDPYAGSGSGYTDPYAGSSGTNPYASNGYTNSGQGNAESPTIAMDENSPTISIDDTNSTGFNLK